MKVIVNALITGIKSSDPTGGTWSKMLVGVLGPRPADKVEVRVPEVMVPKIKALVDATKDKNGPHAGKSVTIEGNFEEALVNGVHGVRTETYTSKDGTPVVQTALYLRLGVDPQFALEVIKPDEGNLDALLASL